MGARGTHVEVEGRAVGDLPPMPGSASHFTAMQVRDGATRGLEQHLVRLERANEATFGTGLDRARVLSLVRRALGDTKDASVRVYFTRLPDIGEPAIVVTVKPPAEIASPQRLRSVDYLRPNAHLKHLATRQGELTRAAQDAGFDDALLTDHLELVAETATANIGFFEGDRVVWPKASMLAGITMQLLNAILPPDGTSRREVRLADVARFDGVVVCNARGIGKVSAIDDAHLPDAAGRVDALRNAYDAVPRDPI